MNVKLDTNKLNRLQVGYLTFSFVSAVLWVAIRNQPLEFITALLVGIFIGSIASKKRKTLFLISILIWFFAVIYDPIMKPLLDLVFEANTVKDFLTSLIINSSLLILFWIGFYFGEKFH